jgi:hypothetical protein
MIDEPCAARGSRVQRISVEFLEYELEEAQEALWFDGINIIYSVLFKKKKRSLMLSFLN